MIHIGCKRKNIIEKVIAICLIFIINTIGYSAIANNDGSAFITKAEFDSLKNNFQAQLDAYNTGIDSKIDAAIASYLAGISLAKKFETTPYVKGLIWSVSSDYRPRYKYAAPRANEGNSVSMQWNDYVTAGGMTHWGSFDCFNIYVSSKKDFDNSTYGQSKLWINNLIKSSTSGGSVAAWQGYDIGAKDEVSIEHTGLSSTHSWASGLNPYMQISLFSIKDAYIYTDVDLEAKCLFEQCANGTTIDNYNICNIYFYIYDVKNYYGTTHMQNIVLFDKSLPYDCFSNKNETKNWCYKGTSENLYTTITTAASEELPDIKDMFDTRTGKYALKGDYSRAPTRNENNFNPSQSQYQIQFSAKPYVCATRVGTHGFRPGDVWYWRGAGFETKYIKNFNQLYNPNLENLASRMQKNMIKGYGSLLTDPNGNVHVGVNAGLPIVQLKKEQKVSMKLRLKDLDLETDKTNANYGTVIDNTGVDRKMYIWAKSSPFTSNDPNSEADLEIKGDHVVKGTGSKYNKGYEVTDSTDPIEIKADDDCIVWLKWSKDADKGGGVIEVPDTITLITDDE